MSSSVVFLTTPERVHNDNHERLPYLFSRAGWHVDRVAHDALNWRAEAVYCGKRPAAAYQLIWPVGLGPRDTFLDRNELLCRVAERCINPPVTYLSLHGKSAWLAYAPETHIAKDAQALTHALESSSEEWVLKPLAGSFGREVHRVASIEEIARIIGQAPAAYWVLQKFIPQISAGETRTLICADQVIGSYLRVPSDGWHANLAADAHAEAVSLSRDDTALVNRVRADLRKAGVRFAAIDTVGGYVMEVNIANPGGLGTLSTLYGAELIEARMCEAIGKLGTMGP